MWTFVSAIFGISLVSSSARAQEPSIDRIEYSALQAGHRASLAVHGKGFKNVRRLALPFVTMAAKEGHDPNADNLVLFEGDVPADVTVGVYPARIVTDQCSSAAQLVVVDDLPVAPLLAESEVLSTASTIPAACSLNGQLNAVRPRFFRINLAASQKVAVEVLARRLNSDLDPVLRVTRADGTEVAFCDDVPGLQGDAWLQFVADSAGDYTIELRDVKYSGGGRHFFHLRVGDFEPGAIRAGISLPQTGALVADEAEPNDEQETANVLPAKVNAISGLLNKPADVDWFRLTVDAAAPLCVTAHTRDANSSADLVLQLWSADGKKLAEADDNGPLDAQLVASLPAAGDYLLRVSELAKRGGSEWSYLLEVNQSEGRVELTLPSDRINIPRGGSASLSASIKRIHYDGPLEIKAVDLPASVSMPPVVLGPKQSVVPLTVSAADSASDDVLTELGALKLQVTAPGREVLVPVFTRTAPPPLKAAAGAFRSMLPRDDLFVAIGPTSQFHIKAQPVAVTIKRGESATIVLTAVRQAEWQMEIAVALAAPADQLPAGLTVADVKFENEKNEAVLTITAAADAAIGKCTVFAQATAKKDQTTAVHPVPSIVVEVVE